MKETTEQEFIKFASKGNVIPVYKEVLGDLETPVAAYMKLAAKSKHAFLLESVEGQEKVARYSFIAKDPEFVLYNEGNVLIKKDFTAKSVKTTKHPFENSPFEIIQEMMSEFRYVESDQLPTFAGGLVGYFSYDCVRYFEKLPDKNPKDVKIPELCLMMAKEIVIFDHLHHTIKLVVNTTLPDLVSKPKKIQIFRKSQQAIRRLERELNAPMVQRRKASKKKISVSSNMTEKQYKDIVNKAKKEIRRGEIIQVVLSQRFKSKIHTDPLNIYRSLRALNPSPYMFFLKFDDLQLVGSSPEMLVRSEYGLVETRPIAGTRPRGKDAQQDEKFAQDLLADPKEKAEHIMLVDLGRNDLGRVCRQGTVNVSEFMAIERYSHVMHIVSNVQGRIKPSHSALDALQAAFPAGTLSGAPKIRAMEIIDELENVRRGPYGGCIGYYSFSGNLDTCITIRTILIKGKDAYVQAGAGIVADSVPKTEYQETLNKAKAQIRAIELAHQ